MPELNLTPECLAQVKAILTQHAPEAEVWAYGSRVKGNSHQASDLDLVIRNPNDLEQPVSHLVELKQAFIDSDLPILIDIIDWAYLPQSYREEIEKQHCFM